MNKFSETYNILRLNHEEIENLNRLITSNEIESAIKKKNSPKTEIQVQMASPVKSTKHLKRC